MQTQNSNAWGVSMGGVQYNTLYEWMWWSKGECVVQVQRTGHFPTSAMVKLPNDTIIEVDVVELLIPKD